MPSQSTGVATPRTISGQALISGLRPHLKRAFAPTVLAIESEAAAPYRRALAEAADLLADLAARDPAAAWGDEGPALIERASTIHGRVRTLLDEAP